jgi:hypothetical protein
VGTVGVAWTAQHNQRLKVFYWSGMKQEVESHIKQCQVCQQAKHELCKYPGLLDPLPIP